ncbi:MAG: tetratricopeptide repeat protein, partial [Gemmatimonadales bacterium]
LTGGNPATHGVGASSSGNAAQPTTGPGRSVSRGARDAYERGLHYLDKRGEANLALAVRLFAQACDSEPLFAAAFDGLGDSYLQLGYLNYLSPDDAFPKAIAAARRAIDLDPTLPNSYATLGFALFYYNRDWTGAEIAFHRAITLDSTYAPAHQRYAYLLAVAGRPDEARAQIQRAEQLAPLSLSIATDAGFILYYENRLNEARTALRGVLARDSLSPAAHLWLGRVEQRDGNPRLARREYDATGPLRQWPPTIAAVGYVDGARGDRASAHRALATLDSISRTRYVTAYAYALVHAALGERDSAFTWLDRSVEERTNWIVWLALDPRWEPIRRDPRFAKLLARAGLPAERTMTP